MWKEGNKHYERQGFPNSIKRWGEYKFCLGELWLFNAFVMLNKTLSKHWLIKISMTCEYIQPEVKRKKKWCNSKDYSCKWSLYRVIRWKLLFDGKGMTLLIAKDVNLLKGIFLVGEMSKFLAVGWVSPPSPGFPINVCEIMECNSGR